ncbi:tetratricopeptide repeat protein [Streptomyces sp. NPDC048723]|uniref:tetratricopeptide repeat protein n=1 Tax=Streptomyces sp. NPDC048723 TaxID=3365589 RepID=UPI00371DB3A2
MVTAHNHSLAVGWADKVAYYAAPRPPVSWPHQVGVLPREAGCFQERAAAQQLEHATTSGGTVVLGQVLTGLGGVGKTQLAAHHARTQWQAGQLDLLVWITAATREAVIASYAQAAVEVLSADPNDPEELSARAFLAWLEPRPEITRRWLVVLDDLADPADLRHLWPPASATGRTLVTTRRRDAALTGHGRRLVPVGLFTEDEATTYLTAALVAHDCHEPSAQLNRLAGELGHLPLALSQAAAYLLDAGLDCATYRRQLADRARTLTDVLPDPSGLPDDQATTVAAAWSLSIDRADRLPPVGLARPMLQIAAVLNPHGIPASVLTSAPALTYMAQHRTTATPEQVHAAEIAVSDATLALRALHRLSLIDHTASSAHHTVRVHQLLQRAVREALPTDQHDRLVRTAGDALTTAWPEIERGTELAQALRANTEALALHAEDVLYQDAAHPVLFRTGRSLGEAGQVAAALHHFRHLADTTQHHLGPDHPDTLAAWHNLAQSRAAAGDPVGAVAAYEQLHIDRERVLGPDHPGTLATRHNLAKSRGEAGDVVGAVTAYEQLLEQMLRVLGPDHPDTLMTRNNLAFWRGEAGDAAGAVTAYEQLLEQTLRVLGPDHPRTLITRNNLALWRGEAGNAVGAVAAYEQLLIDRERVLGPDHPDTLTTRLNLAFWRGEAGDAAGAVTAYEQLLEQTLRVLGPDHPRTLTTRNNLARFRGEAGDASGAVSTYEQLLIDRERVLGPDHPDTLITRNNLARFRGEAGDASGAVSTYGQLLIDRERVLGPDHPHTLATRNNLAFWRGEAGDAAGAVAAYEQLLIDQERVLGPDHPDTLNTRNSLAYIRGEAGDAAGAVAAYEQLLIDQERVLGPDHPHTLATRNQLAGFRGNAGDAAGAVAAYEQLLIDRERVLGPDHPHTLATRNNLAFWRGEAGIA